MKEIAVGPQGISLSDLEDAMKEEKLEQSQFELYIQDNHDFDMALLTMPDDHIIRLYDYLLREEEKYHFVKDPELRDMRTPRICDMLNRLDTYPFIQEHVNQQNLTPEEMQEAVGTNVALLSQRQKVKKKGSIRTWVYNLTQGRKK